MPPSVSAILLAFAKAQLTAPAIQADLIEAAKAMERIEYCDDSPAPVALQERYTELGKRYYKTLFRASGLHGNKIDPNEEVALSTPRSIRRCAERLFAPVEQRAQAALSRAEFRLSQAEPSRAHGLWFGLFPVCRQTVAKAELHHSKEWGVTLAIEFNGATASSFRNYTADFVDGSTVTNSITISLDGLVKASVPVFEPISRVDLNLASESALLAMHRAATSDCATMIDVDVNVT